MGTKEGGKKASATVRERYGDDYYVNLGRLGGVKLKPGNGFAVGETARKSGMVGGKKSKRGKKLIKETKTKLIYLDLKTGQEVKYSKQSRRSK